MDIQLTVSETLRTIETSYPREVSAFAGYLESNGLVLGKASISEYLKELQNRKRQTRAGKFVSYSPAWYNQHLKALKSAIRVLLDRSPELGNGERFNIERYLQGLKQMKAKTGIAKADRIPTVEELETLIDEADPHLSLMIRFLYESSCRISEMLNAEVGQVRRGDRITWLTIMGKGGKPRDVRITTELYDQIRMVFAGSHHIFEHNGRQYSRIATTNRIKQLAERTIGKSVTAHMIRHRRGTDISHNHGLSKAQKELGHTTSRTTADYYDHSKLDDQSYLEGLEA